MKKIYLNIKCLALAFGLMGSVTAQTILDEDFSSDSNWTIVDNDGDGENWTISDGQAWTQSWSSATGALTPDNLLISSQVDLTNVSGTIMLTFDVNAYEAAFAEEHYAVYVTTSSAPADIIAFDPVFEETLPANSDEIYNKSVDISVAAGQQVYITFRHYNVTDENLMILDNVKVIGIGEVSEDLALTEGGNPSYASGNYYLKAEVENVGGETMSSVDIEWTDGTNTYNETHSFGSPLTLGSSTIITMQNALSFTTADIYAYRMKITNSEDSNNSNNYVYGDITGLPSDISTHKLSVFEEGTGAWCGFCPRGAVALEELAESYPEETVGIAVHNGDPMTVTEYDNGVSANIGGYPSGLIDRDVANEHDPGDFPTEASNYYSEKVPVDVSVGSTWNSTTRVIDIVAHANFKAPMKGDLRFAVVVTEDDVIGGNSYNQTNYYDDGSYGALAQPSGFNWVGAGSSVSSSDFGGHDHVARALLGGWDGEANSIPSYVGIDAEISWETSYTLPSSYDNTKTHIIAMIIDAGTGRIVNAFKADLGTGSTTVTNSNPNITGIEDTKNDNIISLFPNPNKGLFQVSFNSFDNVNYEIDVFNLLGSKVYSENGQTFGSLTKSIRLDNVDAGNYFVRITTPNQTFTEKIIVE